MESNLASTESNGFMGWLQRNGLTELSAWGVSLALHVGLFAALATIHIATQVDLTTELFSTIEDQVSEQEFDIAITDQVGSGAEVTSIGGGVPAAEQLAATPETQVEAITDDEMKGPELSAEKEIEVSKDEVLSAVETSGNGTENVQGGTEGAIDRLTLEIAQSLRTKKTLVIWRFDAAQSLLARRRQIADRMETVYKQLDSLDVTKEKALKTAVMTYADKTTVITEKPVDDIRPVLAKIRDIPDPKSAKENVFGALEVALRTFDKHREDRNVMVFIVTDERGDDQGSQGEKLDLVIMQARRKAFKCYCVGNASLFGREQSFVQWKSPDGSTADGEFPVDGGPETIAPEVLALPFFGSRGSDLTRMSAGYGPYALTRLCKETGGLFFIVEEGIGLKHDAAVMRNYQPEYMTVKNYMLQLQKNKAKAKLVEAAMACKLEEVRAPEVAFAAYTDNILREQLTEAQKPAATLDYKLNQLYTILAQGEKDREKLAEPRWRAGYDLAMGRVLAMRARIYGFNRMAAEMKGSPKPLTKKTSNEWRLVPSKNSQATPDVKKMEKSALTYLNRVIDEHPGTPWAVQAQREKDTPLGWEWQEGTGEYDIPNPNESPEQKRIRLAKEEEKKKAAKKAMENRKPAPLL